MRLQLLSISVACLLASNAMGQLPSTSGFSPINYFGRFHGFGYSDGYHACKDQKVSESHSIFAKAWEPMSTIYGTATLPPPRQPLLNPTIGNGYSQQSVGLIYSHPFQNNDYSTGPSINQVAPQIYSQPHAEPVPQMSPQPAVIPPTPSSAPPIRPSIVIPPIPGSQPRNSYEQVPAAPANNTPSPSDRGLLELPAPASPKEPEQVPPAPQAQGNRSIPGSSSALHQSMFRKR